MTTFFVPGIPVAQPRVKAARMGKFIRIYTPNVADNWKRSVSISHKAVALEPYIVPVEVTMAFYMPRPKSHFNKNGLKPNADKWHSSRPDIDNLIKAVLDALTDSGAWEDDSLVVNLAVQKLYTEYQENVGCQVTIVPC